jgi:hypothetical protein
MLAFDAGQMLLERLRDTGRQHDHIHFSRHAR